MKLKLTPCVGCYMSFTRNYPCRWYACCILLPLQPFQCSLHSNSVKFAISFIYMKAVTHTIYRVKWVLKKFDFSPYIVRLSFLVRISKPWMEQSSISLPITIMYILKNGNALLTAVSLCHSIRIIYFFACGETFLNGE